MRRKQKCGNCGYQVVREELYKLVENENLKSPAGCYQKNCLLLGDERRAYSTCGESWIFEEYGCNYKA